MLNLVKIVAALIGCLIVADVVGVIACVVIDVAPLRHNSSALPYAIWFVLGVFTGLFAYSMAGEWTAPAKGREWTAQAGASRRGSHIVGVGAVVMIALGLLFHALYWSRGVAGEYFVPDSAPHTIVFLGTVFASMLFFRLALMPSAKT